MKSVLKNSFYSMLNKPKKEDENTFGVEVQVFWIALNWSF